MQLVSLFFMAFSAQSLDIALPIKAKINGVDKWGQIKIKICYRLRYHFRRDFWPGNCI